MFIQVNPKLPMRNAQITIDFYTKKLGFKLIADYKDYLILTADNIEMHFFLFESLAPKENYGQVYIRSKDIKAMYKNFMESGVAIHPNAPLEDKPWGQREFAILDPDLNLLTFGEEMNQ